LGLNLICQPVRQHLTRWIRPRLAFNWQCYDEKREGNIMTRPRIPNYHRQRFLLVLLAQAGGYLSKIDFQKLLFLSQEETEKPHYDFVPYHYGCYSFQAQSDIDLLESRGWLRTDNRDIRLLEESNTCMPSVDRAKVADFAKRFHAYRGKKLIRYVYEKYPYYAINSRIAEEILDGKAFDRVGEAKRGLEFESSELFTIGYEGITFEKYVNRLISNDVRLLCDVRINPLSRKFGFSKGTLSAVLPKLGIEYVHIPELGISSQRRNGLETKADYARLFRGYKRSLPLKRDSLKGLNELFDRSGRLALTCFEKEHEDCHRHCISEYLEDTRGIEAHHL